MIEINKVIAFIAFFNSIFDDKNKNNSIKKVNKIKYICEEILNLLAFVSVFLIIKKKLILVISLICSNFVSNNNNPSQYAIICLFNYGLHLLNIYYFIKTHFFINIVIPSKITVITKLVLIAT